MRRIPYVLAVKAVIAVAATAIAAEEEEIKEIKVFPGEPIVITALAEPARASEIPFGCKTVTAEEIRSLEVNNLGEALARVEGVYIREYGGAGAVKSVSLRGAAAKQTLVMVDGEPMNNPQGGDVDFNAFALEDVERIEVLAGPSSALYGAGATAGVVNVITRGFPDRTGVYFRGAGGSFGELNSEARVEVPLGKIAVAGGGNYRHSDGFRENDDYTGRGVFLKVVGDVGDERFVSVRTHLQTSATGVPGSLTYPSPDATQDDRLNNLSASFNGRVTDTYSLGVATFLRKQVREYANPAYMIGERHESGTGGGRVTNFVQLTEWNRLAVGGELEHSRTTSTAIGDAAADTWGVFLQEDLRLGEVTVVGGGRYDHSGRYGDVISPRTGVRWRATDNIGLRAAVGRGFRAPTFDELFWPPDPIYGGGGNPNLKPEYCWTYEAGPSLTIMPFLSADLTAFYSDYNNLIVGWPPKNVGRAVVMGAEGDVRVAPITGAPGFGVEVSATYLATKDRETSEKLDYRPALTAFAEVKYSHELSEGKFAVTPSVSTEYVAKQQYTYTDPNTFEQYKRWLPAYDLLNARLGFKVYWAEVYAACKNLTDKEYQVVYDYPMPGRTYAGGVIVEF